LVLTIRFNFYRALVIDVCFKTTTYSFSGVTMTKDITKFRKAIKQSMKPLPTKQSEIELRDAVLEIIKEFKFADRYGINPDLPTNKIQQLIDTACVEAVLAELLDSLNNDNLDDAAYPDIERRYDKYYERLKKLTNQEKSID